MPKYAENTSVSASGSRAEIEQTLTRYGATAFMYGWEGRQAIVGFEINQRRYKIPVPLPDRNSREFTHTAARGYLRSPKDADTAWEQACRQRWRATALKIKADLEWAECTAHPVESVLQPFTMLPNGITVGNWLEPQIQLAYETGHMPPLLPSGE